MENKSKKITNVPNLRFLEFRDDLICKRLDEVVTLHARIGWQGLRQSEFMNSGEYLLITGTDFNNGKINFEKCKYINKNRYEQDKHIQITNKDLLITKDGTIGKIVYVEDLEKPATLNAGVYRVRSVDENLYLPKYIYHYLSSGNLLKYAAKQSTGGTIKHLNQSQIISFPIIFGSKKEQEKISNFFDLLNSKISVQNKIIEDIKLLIKSLKFKIYSTIENYDKRGFTEIFKEYRSFNVNNYNQYTIGKFGIKEMEQSSLYKRDKHIVFNPNSLILGIGIEESGVSLNITGSCSPIYKTYKISNDVDSIFIKHFINYYLNSNKRFITQKSTRREYEINYTELQKIKINIPGISLQNKISALFDLIEKKLSKEEKLKSLLINQKKYLLNNMFI